MIIDLIAILFIIILSSCLCYNDKDYKFGSPCQMSHILIGLSVIVFYKVVRLLKAKYNPTPKTENFYDINTDLTNFINGSASMTPNQFQSLSTTDKDAYIGKITELQNTLNSIRDSLQSPGSNNLPSTSGNAQFDSTNLEAKKAFQNYQLKFLEDQVKKSKELVNEQNNIITAKRYKPIKVYSSCIVSNADGTTEKPVPTGNTTSSSLKMSTTPGDSNTLKELIKSISQTS